MSLTQLSLLDFSAQAREIPLTQGKVAIVSACDYDWLNQWKWYTGKCGYAQRNWLSELTGKRTVLLMHRFITTAPANKEVDHIDGDRLNNRRENLRLCSHEQNMHNQKSQTGASRYKGVAQTSDSQTWRAYISKDGSQIYLGSFATEIEAALTYNTAAVQLFGEFARLNQIDGARE